MKEEVKLKDFGKYKNDRHYRRAFKLKILDDLVANQESDSFIDRKYGTSRMVSHLRQTVLKELGYYRILEEMKKPEKGPDSSTDQEVEQLKKALELATMKVAALETLIDVAEEQFNLDIRKKGGSKQSK